MGCTSENAKLTNGLAIVERLLPTRFRLLDDLPCPRLVFFALHFLRARGSSSFSQTVSRHLRDEMKLAKLVKL